MPTPPPRPATLAAPAPPTPEAETVGLGGGCHWCTEAVFQALRGVQRVDQGWIASRAPHDAPSEAVLVHFDPREIPLRVLVEAHLLTHASTSDHAMRGAYRSAVYALSDAQAAEATRILEEIRAETGEAYVTRVLPFAGYAPGYARFQDYYRTRPDAPFCQTYIAPKLARLRREFGAHAAPEA